MQTDPIADFLTRLRNAAAAKHQRVDVPVSKLKTEIARILKEEGYISTYKMVEEKKARNPSRGRRTGHQHSHHAKGCDDRPHRAQVESWRRDSL